MDKPVRTDLYESSVHFHPHDKSCGGNRQVPPTVLPVPEFLSPQSDTPVQSPLSALVLLLKNRHSVTSFNSN